MIFGQQVGSPMAGDNQKKNTNTSLEDEYYRLRGVTPPPRVAPRPNTGMPAQNTLTPPSQPAAPAAQPANNSLGGAPGYNPDALDASIGQWAQGNLSGPRDTSADEAAMYDAMMAALGQQRADSAAQLGRMGFGASGAASALDADLVADAAREAELARLGIRADARDESLRAGSIGVDAALGLREADRRDAYDEAMAQILEQFLTGEDAGGAAPGSSVGSPQRNATERSPFGDFDNDGTPNAFEGGPLEGVGYRETQLLGGTSGGDQSIPGYVRAGPSDRPGYSIYWVPGTNRTVEIKDG